MADKNSTIEIICLATYHGRGGAQNNAAKLVREFRKRGYKSKLVFMMEREPSTTFQDIDDVVILSQKGGFLGLIQSGLGFVRFVRKDRPRAVIGFFPISNVVGALAASTIKDCAFVGSLRNPADRQNKWVSKLEKLTGASRLTRGIIAVSQTVATSFGSYPAAYKDKMNVVYNTTPVLVPVTEAGAQCRESLGLPANGVLLGCLGRLHKQKNVGHAISVLAQLPDTSTILVLAGEGVEEAMLREKSTELGVADRVIFLGSISGADVTRFYRALDIFLFPSIYEGFGLTLVEAMSQGCLVLSSDLDITREVAGDGAAIVPLEPSAWCQTIETLLEDPAEAESLRMRGYARAAHFGDQDVMVDGYLHAAGIIE
jgi:glycosyltransferase involved in cell wall biosynthesis